MRRRQRENRRKLILITLIGLMVLTMGLAFSVSYGNTTNNLGFDKVKMVFKTGDKAIFTDATTTVSLDVSQRALLPTSFSKIFTSSMSTAATLNSTATANQIDCETFYVTENGVTYAYSFTGWHIVGTDTYLPAKTVFQPNTVMNMDLIDTSYYTVSGTTATVTLEALWGKVYFVQNQYTTMKYAKDANGYYKVDHVNSTGSTGASDSNDGLTPNTPLASIGAIFAKLRADTTLTGADAYKTVIMLTGNLEDVRDTNDPSASSYWGGSSSVLRGATYKSLQTAGEGTKYNLLIKPKGYSNTYNGSFVFDNIYFGRVSSSLVGGQSVGSEYWFRCEFVEATTRFTDNIGNFRVYATPLVVLNGGSWGLFHVGWNSSQTDTQEINWYFGGKASASNIYLGMDSAYTTGFIVRRNANLIINGGTISQDVFTGSAGSCAMDVGLKKVIVYGDGSGSTMLDPSIRSVYGGSAKSRSFGDSYVKITNCTNISNVYGGGRDYTAIKYGNVYIDIKNSRITGSIYGGGLYADTLPIETTYKVYGDDGKSYTTSPISGLNFSGYTLTPGDGGSVNIDIQNSKVVGSIYGSGVGASQSTSVTYRSVSLPAKWYSSLGEGDPSIYPSGWAEPLNNFPIYDEGTGRISVYAYKTMSWGGLTPTSLSGQEHRTDAYLSLAQVGNVNITIDNSEVGTSSNKVKIYGGGAIAKVLGDTNIVIKGNSKIYGDVYGGGDGATVPAKVRLYKSIAEIPGVTYKYPTYNLVSKDSNGLPLNVTTTQESPYLPSNLSNSQYIYGDYTWSADETLLLNETPGIDHDRKLIYSPNAQGLGAVLGDVNVTIEGSSSVTGQVFGGGNAGRVAGDITLNISDAIVSSNIYGGCNTADAEGNVYLTMSGTNSVAANIYGGGNEGIAGVVNATISGTNVTGNVYAGGNKNNVARTSLIMSDSSATKIFGGGNVGNVNLYTVVDLTDVTATEVFGGGYAGNVGDTTDVIINSGTYTRVFGGCDQGEVIGSTTTKVGTTDNPNVVISDVLYGGGRGVDSNGDGDASDFTTVWGTANVTITGMNTRVENYGSTKLGSVAGNVNVDFINYRNNNATKPYITMNGIDRATKVSLENSYIALENMGADGKKEGIKNIGTLEVPAGSGLKVTADSEITNDFIGGGYFYLDSEVTLIVGGDMTGTTELVINPQLTDATSDVDSPLVIKGGLENAYLVVKGSSDASNIICKDSRYGSRQKYVHGTGEGDFATVTAGYFYIDGDVGIDEQIENIIASIDGKDYHGTTDTWTDDVVIYQDGMFTANMNISYDFAVATTDTVSYRNINRQLMIKEAGVGGAVKYFPAGTQITMIAKDAEGNITIYKKSITAQTQKVSLNDFVNVEDANVKYVEINNLVEDAETSIEGSTATSTIYKREEEFRFIVDFTHCTDLVEVGEYILHFDIYNGAYQLSALQDAATNVVELRTARPYNVTLSAADNSYIEQSNIPITTKIVIGASTLAGKDRFANYPLYTTLTVKDPRGNLTSLPDGTVITVNGTSTTLTNGATRIELLNKITESARNETIVINVDMTACDDYQLQSGIYTFNFDVYLKDTEAQKTLVNKTFNIMLNRKDENYSVNGQFFETLTDAMNYIETNNMTTATIKVEIGQTTSEKLTVDEGQNITFDLNRKTMKMSRKNNSILIYGKLTICGNGTIEAVKESNAILIENRSELILDNVTVEHNGISKSNIGSYTSGGYYALYSPGTDLEIRNSTILLKKADGVTNDTETSAAINMGSGDAYLENTTIESVNTGIGTYGAKEVNLVINGGNITAQAEAIHNVESSNTNITIKGNARLTSVGDGNSEHTNWWIAIKKLGAGTLTIGEKDATVNETPVIQGKTLAIRCNNSTFNYYDGLLIAETTNTISKQPDNIPVGYKVNQRMENGLYITYLEDIRNCMYNGTYYETLNDAYLAINEDGINGTIEVLRDFSETDDVGIPVMGESVTIDTNGFTITRDGMIEIARGKLNVIGAGKITSSGPTTIATTGGSLDVQDATISNTAESGAAIDAPGGSVIINGKITSEGSVACGIYIGGGNVEFTGGEIIARGTGDTDLVRGVVLENGTLTVGTSGGSMSITEPKITSDGSGIENLYGTLKFYDGRIKGKYSSYIGAVNVTEVGYDMLTTTDTDGYYLSYLAGDITPPTINRTFVDAANASEVGYKITITDNGYIDEDSLKYLWTTKTSGITRNDLTESYANGQTIVGPYATTGTYYLWVVASDVDGNTTLSGPGTAITFENPRIEIGQKDLGLGVKELTVFAYNRENIYEGETPQTSNGATVSETTSQYVHGTAWQLDKTGVGLQKHYLDGVYENKFSGLAEDTYVVVASDYKTTNAAGVENFTATNIYKPGKAGTYLADNVLSNLEIIDDGNFHHVVNVIKLNQDTAAANAEISSGLPNWDSTSAGSMTVDGIQWYTIPASELSNGVGTIKWAYGDKNVEYFRTAGNEVSNLASFKVAQNGTYTAYMKTPSGKETIQKIEVTSVDEAQAFITTWNIPSDGYTITYPISGNVDAIIDWGDGTASAVTEGFPTHTYATAGDYAIKVYGAADLIGLVDTEPEAKYATFNACLTAITNWGEGDFKRFGFVECVNLTSVANNATENTFANVTSMGNMFYGCIGLESISVTSFKTTNITDMSGLFKGCTALANITATNMDTSNVKNMSGMFQNCTSLKSFPGTNWNTTALEDASYMFAGDTGFVTMMFYNIESDNLRNTTGMFSGMTNLTTIFVTENLNTSNVTASENMFYGSTKLQGGAITDYDSSKTDISMANIDKVKDPGYFTKIQYRLQIGQNMWSAQTLNRALEICEQDGRKNGQIVLLGNAEDDVSVIIPEGTYININLREFTLTVLDMPNGFFIKNNGTLNITNLTGSIEYVGESPAIVIENNGTFTLGKNDTTVGTSAPVIKGGTYAVYGNVESTNFYDGVLKGTVAPIGGKYTTPDTYAVKTVEETIDGTKYYKGTLDLGSYTVGSKYYYSLKDAIDAIETTGTIKVYKNNTDTYLATVPSGKTITLDLNGKTITKTTNNIVVDGELTITDTTATPGTITGSFDVMFAADTGTVTFDKGNFTQTKNNGTLIRSYNGVINVVEATMKSNGDAIVSMDDAAINIGDSSTEVSETVPLIMANNIAVSSNTSWNWYDGVLKARQQTIYTAIPNEPIYYTPESGEELLDGVTYYKTWLARDSNYQVGDKFFASIKECFDEIKANGKSGTITVLRNVDDYSKLNIEAGYTVEIDTDGKIITLMDDNPIYNYGVLNLSGGGTITTRAHVNNNVPMVLTNYGTLNVNDVTLISTGTSLAAAQKYTNGNFYTVMGATGSTININGGNVQLTKTSGITNNSANHSAINTKGNLNVTGGTIDSMNYGVFMYEATGEVNITGGKINSNKHAIYEVNSKTQMTLNIKGGNITSSSDSAIRMAGKGTLTIGATDGTSSNPLIQGAIYGVSVGTDNFYFYDGIISGKTAAYEGKALTAENKAVYHYEDGTYKYAVLEMGWDISAAQDGSIYAYLIPNGSNYTLEVVGSGVTKGYEFEEISNIPWYSYRNKITAITFEGGITELGRFIFAELPKITALTLPNSLTTIGLGAFYGATSLTSAITIPAAVTTINSNPFILVPIKSMSVAAGNTNFKVSNNMLMTIDGTRIVSYLIGNTETNVEIPGGVTTLSAHSFQGMKATNITIPSTVTTIEACTFFGTGLKELVIPASVQMIGQSFVYNSASLEKVYFLGSNFTLDGVHQFFGIKSGSAIHTRSAEVATKFTDGTHYDSSITTVYYPPVVGGTLLDTTVNSMKTVTFEVTPTPGVPETIKYIWEVKRVGTDTWVPLMEGQGLNTAKYTTAQLTVTNSGDEFRCTINNIDGNGTTIYPNIYMPITDSDMTTKLISDTAKVYVRAANYEVNGEFFATLEDAVAAVPAGTATTIKLLTNMEDNSLVTIPADRNVTLNIQGFTLNRKDKVITNNGTMNITGTGTLKVESATLIDNKGTLKITQDAINIVSSASAVAIINSGSVELNKLSLTTAFTALQNTSGTVKVNGGTIIVDGKANVSELSGWVINGGTVEILGGTLDINNTTGTVINLDVKSGATLNVAAGLIVSNNTAIRNNGGTVTVTGGEISANDKGIENLGTSGNVTIGINDGSVYDDTVIITSKIYGYYSDTSAQLSFFDGTIKGMTSAIAPRATIKPIITPDEYDVNYSALLNSGYETATLVRANYYCEGSWFGTLNDVITEIYSSADAFIAPIDIYAGDNFTSITDTEAVTVTNLSDEGINLILRNGVAIDFEKTITVNSGVMFNVINEGALGTINATVVNNGTLDLKANLIGTLTNNGTATIGATSGTLVNTVSGSITNTGAMTINKTTVTGSVTSSGSALTLNGAKIVSGVTLSNGCKFTMTAGEVYRSNGTALTNSGTGAIEVLGGVIEGTAYGINNTGTGTITIGSLTNGVISSGDPIITGGTYGVKTSADFNFYDGMLRGKTGSYQGTVTAVEEGTHIKKDTPEGNGTDYHRAYIEDNDVFVEVWDISKTAGTDEVYAGVKVVKGDGVNADTRYKLVVWGTGATKDYELTSPNGGMRVSTAPWVENYRTKIVALELEDGVSIYGDHLFFGLNDVQGELVIPETIEKLGTSAFANLYSISGNIHIPEKLLDMMDTNPFVSSNNSSFTVAEGNPRYEAQNGTLYDMKNMWLVAHPCGSELEEVVVKDGIIRIGGSAFTRNKTVKSFVFPDSLLQIGNSAFSQTAIESIEIPSSVTYIFGGAFLNASSLKTVYLKSTSFTHFTPSNTFVGLAPNSIIYTESKEIADLFVPGTTYTTANTSIYYPFKVLEMPEDFALTIEDSIKIEPTIRNGNPTNDVVYQWYLNGNPIAGANSATYTKPTVVDSDSGDYQVLIKSALQEDGTYYYSHMSEKTNLRVRDHVGPESVSISVSYFDDDDGVGFAQVTVTASDSYSGVDKFYVNGAELTTGVDITNDGTGLTGGTGVAVFNIKTKGTYTISVADAEDNRTNRELTAYLIEYFPGSDYQVTGDTKSQIAIRNFSMFLRPCDFVKTGYTFTGWKDHDGALFGPEEISDIAWDFYEDTKYTAQWQINTYVVEFWNDAGNGPQLVEIKLYEYEDKIDVPELQYHVAEMVGEDQYKIYRHKNNWKATTLDDQSVFKAEDINADNINSIWMVDSDVRYDTAYEVTTYDIGNATVYLDGEMSVSGTIQNDEGVIFIGPLPTIYGPVYNNNGLIFYN